LEAHTGLSEKKTKTLIVRLPASLYSALNSRRSMMEKELQRPVNLSETVREAILQFDLEQGVENVIHESSLNLLRGATSER
jgi:hypothetical protein